MTMPERPWHRSYPADMPWDAAIEPGLTLPMLLDRSFERYAERMAYTCFGEALTYRQVDEHSRMFAAFLQGRGFERGDRVGLMLPNSLAYPIVLAGVLRAGLIVVSMNPLYTARELAHQVRNSGASAIVTTEAVLPL